MNERVLNYEVASVMIIKNYVQAQSDQRLCANNEVWKERLLKE